MLVVEQQRADFRSHNLRTAMSRLILRTAFILAIASLVSGFGLIQFFNNGPLPPPCDGTIAITGCVLPMLGGL